MSWVQVLTFEPQNRLYIYFRKQSIFILHTKINYSSKEQKMSINFKQSLRFIFHYISILSTFWMYEVVEWPIIHVCLFCENLFKWYFCCVYDCYMYMRIYKIIVKMADFCVRRWVWALFCLSFVVWLNVSLFDKQI